MLLVASDAFCSVCQPARPKKSGHADSERDVYVPSTTSPRMIAGARSQSCFVSARPTVSLRRQPIRSFCLAPPLRLLSFPRSLQLHHLHACVHTYTHAYPADGQFADGHHYHSQPTHSLSLSLSLSLSTYLCPTNKYREFLTRRSTQEPPLLARKPVKRTTHPTNDDVNLDRLTRLPRQLVDMLSPTSPRLPHLTLPTLAHLTAHRVPLLAPPHETLPLF
ncbi:uncharacterized protein IWZ02DRAFT_42011 [Phyllosticta citriasiana]|uniref:uncharacterized protein n=1 Tax=Phyllosticta citriasiana TaxID=595635 RepID=UPI0030FDC0CB